MRRHPLTALAALAIALLAACSGPVVSAGVSPTPVPSPAAVVALEVEAGPGTELVFEPDRVLVPAGRPVRIVFENRGDVAHNLSFTGALLGVETQTIIEPGASDVVAFDAPDPGTYEFVCSIHPGMTGWLVVGW